MQLAPKQLFGLIDFKIGDQKPQIDYDHLSDVLDKAIADGKKPRNTCKDNGR